MFAWAGGECGGARRAVLCDGEFDGVVVGEGGKTERYF